MKFLEYYTLFLRKLEFFLKNELDKVKNFKMDNYKFKSNLLTVYC